MPGFFNGGFVVSVKYFSIFIEKIFTYDIINMNKSIVRIDNKNRL